METLSFQAPLDVKEKLEFFAKAMDRSKGYLIRQALVEYLEDLQDYHEAVAYHSKYDSSQNLSLADVKRKYGLK